MLIEFLSASLRQKKGDERKERVRGDGKRYRFSETWFLGVERSSCPRDQQAVREESMAVTQEKMVHV